MLDLDAEIAKLSDERCMVAEEMPEFEVELGHQLRLMVVEDTMRSAVARGLVTAFPNEEGRLVYSLTDEGLTYFSGTTELVLAGVSND
jgi:hypothetical protein